MAAKKKKKRATRRSLAATRRAGSLIAHMFAGFFGAAAASALQERARLGRLARKQSKRGQDVTGAHARLGLNAKRTVH